MALILFTTLINIMLSYLMRSTDLPFYVDTVGTILATALGGTVPGIITAFATNTANFLMDGESIYYASLNVMIALLSAVYFGEITNAKRNLKKEKKNHKAKPLQDLLLFIVVLAVVGGLFGGAITWYLGKANPDYPLFLFLTEWFSEKAGFGTFGCHMATTFVVDLMDKAISVCLSLLIIYITPAKVKEYVRLSTWKQKTLSYKERKKSKKRLKGRFSLGLRVNILIIGTAILMAAVSVIFIMISFRESTTESLSATASQMAYLAAQEIEPDMVDIYLKNGYSAPGYIETRERLKKLKDSSEDIAFLYVYKISKDGWHVVFDLDSVLDDGSFVDAFPPGMTVPFEDEYESYLEDLFAGKNIPNLRIDDQFGSFLAAGCPVYNDDGRCVCYAITDIEVGLINKRLEHLIGRLILLFLGFLLLMIAVSVVTTKYRIVMPLSSMTSYANQLTDQVGGANEETLEMIRELDIRTGDEMELLYRALCKLTGETVFQLNDNKNKSDAITKMQNALIITMADMVESRDSDTGAHVLKTSAYVRIILEGLRRNGYYTEKLSDRYIRDVEMSAPLHDLGKINIPDSILNKPGKLTDEEYRIMKTHTTAGRDILEKAIRTMGGDNYLREARNMAAYHHERWDGKGYPDGIHGEVIPLSARVMAIADVFDALSSHRVYKPAFPFDEAVQMIKDGAGTQFDPKCVEVFVESVAEVKKVLKRYQEL
ncbi:MAG: HD domain-containing protein [Lachnospiraceae bacterium]|nr:HD domain-containing protein [Lachnospiraceae bacterium]